MRKILSMRGALKLREIKRLKERVEEMRILFIETKREGARAEWARAIHELEEAIRNRDDSE